MDSIVLSSCPENEGVHELDLLEIYLEDRRQVNSFLSPRDYSKVWFLLVTLDRILWIPLLALWLGLNVFHYIVMY